jgi:hypothetical protein
MLNRLIEIRDKNNINIAHSWGLNFWADKYRYPTMLLQNSIVPQENRGN